jgi:hypothetical protein
MLDLRRVGPALWIAAALCVALPASASGAVTIGQSPPTAGVSVDCAPGMAAQLSVSSGNPYVVPSGGGVITRWRSSATGRVALQVFRQSGANHTLIAEDRRTIGGNLTEFEVRIPVSGADKIGLKVPGMVMVPVVPGCAFLTSNPGDIAGVNASQPVGSTVTFTTVTGFRFNVAADVEPDADKDDYGDETQDLCPTDVSKQTDCVPPETTITKGAPNKTKKSKVKLKFTSSEPDSTFQCKLDKNQFKACTSPRKVKNLDEGKHKFKVRAVDAAGNVDPSPAKDKFRVVD